MAVAPGIGSESPGIDNRDNLVGGFAGASWPDGIMEALLCSGNPHTPVVSHFTVLRGSHFDYERCLTLTRVNKEGLLTNMATTSEQRAQRLGRVLRPSAKVLPEHARAHNRALVLQQLFHFGPISRASIARATGLTRVTVSDLVAVLISEGLVEELGTQTAGRVGKPATLLGMRTSAFHIVTVDLTAGDIMRGGIVTLTGDVVDYREQPVDGQTGQDMTELVTKFCRLLVSASKQPVIGIGIGSPGVVDAAGTVVNAPNRGWYNVPLAEILTSTLGIPTHVANDADTAALGELTFGGADPDGLLIVTVGEGVGAGLLVDGSLVRGVNHAAGEIGHVQVVEDGATCACGRIGCLETVLSAPALHEALVNRSTEDAAAHLAYVGKLLGTLLSPVISALNIGEVLLSGPADVLDGPLRESVVETVNQRTMPAISSGLSISMATLGQDVVLRGAAVLVLSGQLGVS